MLEWHVAYCMPEMFSLIYIFMNVKNGQWLFYKTYVFKFKYECGPQQYTISKYMRGKFSVPYIKLKFKKI